MQINEPVTVFVHFEYFCFRPFHYTVYPLDAQHLTAALVAVEDVDLSLRESSIEALEELLSIPTQRQLKLKVDVVSDHVSSLSVASLPTAGVGPEWSLSLVCSGSYYVFVPTLHRIPSVISKLAHALS